MQENCRAFAGMTRCAASVTLVTGLKEKGRPLAEPPLPIHGRFKTPAKVFQKLT